MPSDRLSLWQLIARAGLPPGRFIEESGGRVAWRDFAAGSSLDVDAAALAGRCVLVWARGQLPAALAAVALDGLVRRIVFCPPDFPEAQLPAAIADAGVDFLLHDGSVAVPAGLPAGRCGTTLTPAPVRPAGTEDTEWVLFTSGTTGRPKMLIHTLPGLTGPLDDGMAVAAGAVWSTFYDIRRYGGLQILLRACLGGGSMVLSDAQESLAAFLARAGRSGVTHISGTPSHWRRALMSPAAGAMAPSYVRLSGEVADQAILNNLKLAYPGAAVAHAFASTEAGVALDVRDGLAGFPASLLAPGGKIDMRVEDGSLRIRSSRVAVRYIGAQAPALADADGYVDTGDMVELRDGRYFFVGRREGIINVGGQKVHPEEVEAVVNAHPGVRMSRVRGRANPITGAIVAADVVLSPGYEVEAVAAEVLAACRERLPVYKVPALVNAVEALDLGAAGKLSRRA